ncbi:MAG: hypothetical protein BGO25_04725 [Acidobacteriales bacterium 59-55]|nr:hypothetical protein [Terriglobales bacterium]OJV44675.1 MAG: hypothetical protein BGO25_04725 [Acidobacteriales bacterium 59-55]
MHFLIIGGSDAGISSGLRAHELDPSCEITLVLAQLAFLPVLSGLDQLHARTEIHFPTDAVRWRVLAFTPGT